MGSWHVSHGVLADGEDRSPWGWLGAQGVARGHLRGAKMQSLHLCSATVIEIDCDVVHGGQGLMRGQSWNQSRTLMGDIPMEKPCNDGSSCLKL